MARLRWNTWKTSVVNTLPLHPLILPTDLTLERQQQQQRRARSSTSAEARSIDDYGNDDGVGDGDDYDDNEDDGDEYEDDNEIDDNNRGKTPISRTKSSERNNGRSGMARGGGGGGARCNSENSTPRHGISMAPAANANVAVEKQRNLNADIFDAAAGVYGKYAKRLTEEEATTLMLKAAAERNAGGSNASSYADNSMNLIKHETATAAAAGVGYKTSLASAVGGGFGTDVVGSTAGLCNINMLSSLTAMMGGAGGTGSAAGSISNVSNSTTALTSLSGAGVGVAVGASSFGGNAANNSMNTSAGGGGGGADASGGHECPECKRKYKLKSSLRNHQKWECGKEPQFQCPFCSYRAKQKMHIGRHLERMHKEKFLKLEMHSSASASDDTTISAAAAAAAAAAEMRQHF